MDQPQTPLPETPGAPEPAAAGAGSSRNMLIAGGVGLLAVVAAATWWADSGADANWAEADNAELADAPDDAVRPATARPAVAAVPAIRGIIKPRNESAIASRMTARITAMPFREGQSFGAGAVLARFDCSALQAELNAARAAATAYRATHSTNVELDQYEAVGRNEVAVSAANLGRAQAEGDAIAAQMSDCSVRAPFSGTVVEQIAHVREVAASGQPIMRIQSGSDVELELIVPSNWLTWLAPGATFRFAIDETGNTITGRITRLGASVDPVSRTIRVTGVVMDSSGLILPGMSGSATFDDPRASGQPVRPGALPAAGRVAPQPGAQDNAPAARQ